MPLAQLKPVEFDPDSQPRAQAMRAGADVAAVASPARLLQHQLDLHASPAAEPFVEKWPLRRAVAFILLSSLALWAAIIAAAAQVYHAIA